MLMESNSRRISKKHRVTPVYLRVLQQTTYFFDNSDSQAYLVGGSVRNFLLDEPCSDWDIVTDGDYLKLGRQLAIEAPADADLVDQVPWIGWLSLDLVTELLHVHAQIVRLGGASRPPHLSKDVLGR